MYLVTHDVVTGRVTGRNDLGWGQPPCMTLGGARPPCMTLGGAGLPA